jgi:primary-amine oxidase
MTMEDTVLGASGTAATRYPLDPLTGEEIQAAAAVLMASEYATPTLKFVMIHLAEPAKTEALSFDGLDLPRRAFATMYDAAAKSIYEAVVDLRARVIEAWKSVPGRFPSYLVEHMTGVEEKVRADPRWQAAMTKRGITDFGLAMIDPWPAGYYGRGDHYDNSPLFCRPLTFMRAAPSEHGYARPVEGLIVTFDLDNMVQPGIGHPAGTAEGLSRRPPRGPAGGGKSKGDLRLTEGREQPPELSAVLVAERSQHLPFRLLHACDGLGQQRRAVTGQCRRQ